MHVRWRLPWPLLWFEASFPPPPPLFTRPPATTGLGHLAKLPSHHLPRLVKYQQHGESRGPLGDPTLNLAWRQFTAAPPRAHGHTGRSWRGASHAFSSSIPTPQPPPYTIPPTCRYNVTIAASTAGSAPAPRVLPRDPPEALSYCALREAQFPATARRWLPAAEERGSTPRR